MSTTAGPRTLRPAGAWVAAGVVLSVCAAITLLTWVRQPAWHDWAGVIAATEFATMWAVLRTDPRLRPNARPCLAAAALLVGANVGIGAFGPGQFFGFLLQTVVVVPILMLLLRYPYPRIVRRLDRTLVVVVTLWTLSTQLLIAVVWTPQPEWHEWWPTVIHGNHYEQLMWKIANIGSLALTAVGLYLVMRRAMQARGPDRRELWPVAVAGLLVAAGVATTVGSGVTRGSRGDAVDDAAVIVYALVPIAFLVVAIQRRLARARIAELTTRVGAPRQPATGPHGLRAELRYALSDPVLEILYWVDNSYVDEDGKPGTPLRNGHLVVPIPGHDGEPLAVLITHPSLQGHRDLVDAAVAATSLALENARLQAALSAQLVQVRSAQQRIVEAGLSERRRIERDLHDGAQQRLLAASMTLARAQEPDCDSAPLLDLARTQVRTALAELRDLARGIHPAVLSQSGLAAAVESLAEHSPVAVSMDIPAHRWPPAAESTAYFVIAEGLANAAKHAPESHVSIYAETVGNSLAVCLLDDGPGGADAAQGTGLTGLADRVRAIGGTFEITSARGAGTHLTAAIPCE